MEKASERSQQHETLKKAFLKLEELQQRLAAAEHGSKQPIAVVGVACRFPGGIRDIEDYWQLLREGRSAISDVPADRWDVDKYYDPNPEAVGKMYCRKGGFLAGVDQFDPHFFGITPREVLHMDPQQRILLEVSWEALERAAIAPDSLIGSKTGVFTGVGFNDYSRLLSQLDLSEMNAYTGPGTQICFASGRVSYTLGLRGPSVPIDTACSSSLVAMHLACQSLRQGESDLALSGGVNLVLVPEGNVWLSRAGAIAPDGHCKTFDAKANGFVRGEGCAVLVLKRLDDALRDRDPVYAVIRGSAVNHDGRSSGLTVPSGPAQEALLRQALANAGLQPEQVSYLEAHGTGTSLGDPIELRAVLAVLGRAGQGPRKTPLTVGSVKTNFGHLEAASGVAGLVKLILMLRHQQIPPHLHFSELNPVVALDGVDLRVPTTLGEWQIESGDKRRGGVSSFGLSGTNAHVILEEAPPSKHAPRATALSTTILPISAAKPEALEQLVRAYCDSFASEGTALADVCFSAGVGRNHLDYRLAVTATTAREAADALSAHLDGKTTPSVRAGRRPLVGTAKLAFVFPDAQAMDAGKLAKATVELLADDAFRTAFSTADALFVAHGHTSLLEELRRPEPETGTPTSAAALAFCFQTALASFYEHAGVQPEGVVGVGLGEVAAACVAGALTLEAAVSLVHQGVSRSALAKVSASSGGDMPCASGTDGVRVLVADSFQTFLELSPDLSGAEALQKELGNRCVAIAAGRKLGVGRSAISEAFAELYCLGHALSWGVVLRDGTRLPTLPNYPWQHQRYWIDLSGKVERHTGEAHRLLGYALPPSAARPELVAWELDWGAAARVPLAARPVAGQRRLSSADLTRLAFAAAKEAFGDELLTVANLSVHRPLVLSDEKRAVQVSVSTEKGGAREFQVHSRPANTDPATSKWVLHASASLARS